MTRAAPINQAFEMSLYISNLLAQITVANGYNTDIGAKVLRGRRKIDDTQVPCAVMIEGEDHPGDNIGRDTLKITQDYVLGGYVRCDPDHPNDAAHLVLKDIKKALFPDSRDLNFGGRALKVRYVGRDIGPRADGVPIVYAVVHIEVDYAEALFDA